MLGVWMGVMMGFRLGYITRDRVWCVCNCSYRALGAQFICWVQNGVMLGVKCAVRMGVMLGVKYGVGLSVWLVYVGL